MLGATNTGGSFGHYKSRVSDQNGVSLLYDMLEIHHSGQEPSKCKKAQLSLAVCLQALYCQSKD